MIGKKGFGIALEKPVSWMIPLFALIFFIWLIFGPAQFGNKIRNVWDEIIGSNIAENPDNSSIQSDSVTQLKTIEYMETLMNYMRLGKLSKQTSCLISIPQTIGDKGAPGNLGDLQIHFQSSTANDVSKVYGIIKKNGKEVYRANEEIEGLTTCLIGDSSTYSNFKLNWNLESEGYKTKEIGGNYHWPDRFDGTIVLRSNNDIKTSKDEYNFEKDNIYLYKADSTHICFFADNSDEDKYLTSRIPLCQKNSGFEKKPYDCFKKVDSVIYFFKIGEYYCENHDPDKIVRCESGNKWQGVKTKEGIPSCYGTGIPYNKADSCCCDLQGCIRQFDESKGKITECGAPEFGPEWQEKNCPEDISFRVGWYEK